MEVSSAPSSRALAISTAMAGPTSLFVPGRRTMQGGRPQMRIVVFSRPDVFEVDTAAFGLNGVQLGGSGEYQWTGQAVAGAGDINGDGRSDVVVGSPAGVRDFSSTEAPYAGSAAVVFGR